jgi:hypothetical protein
MGPQGPKGEDGEKGEQGDKGDPGDPSGIAWGLTGNAATTGANRLGTTDNVTFTMIVSGTTGFRIIPVASTMRSPNIVGGAEANQIWQGASASVISGGGSKDANYRNLVTDSYSVVAGGFANVAGNSAGDFSDSLGATVSGGYQNNAVGLASTVAGGNNNWARGANAVVSGGAQNEAIAASSVIPGGTGAIAHESGIVYASGSFNGPLGAAQTGIYVLRRQIGPGADQPLYLDGTSNQLNIPTNATVSFQIQLVARTDTELSGAWEIRGSVQDVDGTLTLVGNLLHSKISDRWLDVKPKVLIDNTNHALSIVVTNNTGTFMRCVATVYTTEVLGW